jgi:hypothetical protein
MGPWTKRVIVALVVGFFIFYLISNPEGAASAVRTVFNALGIAFRAVVQFFSSLAA